VVGEAQNRTQAGHSAVARADADEAGNVAPLRSLAPIASTGRGRGIRSGPSNGPRAGSPTAPARGDRRQQPPRAGWPCRGWTSGRWTTCSSCSARLVRPGRCCQPGRRGQSPSGGDANCRSNLGVLVYGLPGCASTSSVGRQPPEIHLSEPSRHINSPVVLVGSRRRVTVERPSGAAQMPSRS